MNSLPLPSYQEVVPVQSLGPEQANRGKPWPPHPALPVPEEEGGRNSNFDKLTPALWSGGFKGESLALQMGK